MEQPTTTNNNNTRKRRRMGPLPRTESASMTRNGSDTAAPPPSIMVLTLPPHAHVLRWLVPTDSWVHEGDVLCSSYDEAKTTENKVEQLIAPHDGMLEILVPDGAGEGGAPIANLTFCLHPTIVFGDVCAICGHAPSKTRSDRFSTVVQGGHTIQVTHAEAMNARESSLRRLFDSKRLSLVLDLDHTLLHCTDDPRGLAFAEQKNPSVNVSTFDLGGKRLVLKTRPGLTAFLKDMSVMFEMYIYTAGTRSYAECVAAIIDPDGSLFGGRIVARDDVPEMGLEKSLTRLFPVDDSMVVVVDDRDVWNSCPNLLTCEPYEFFVDMHEVNNSGWKSATSSEGEVAIDGGVVTSIGGTATPTTGSTSSNDLMNSSGIRSPRLESLDPDFDAGLSHVSSLLHKIHRMFYYPSNRSITAMDQLSGTGSDVKKIMTSIHNSILAKCRIAFDPALPKVKPSQLCGAECTTVINESLTHFISLAPDSPLTKRVMALGAWIVTPRWLELCDHYWERVQEEKHLLLLRVPGSSMTVPVVASGGGSSSNSSSSERPYEQHKMQVERNLMGNNDTLEMEEELDEAEVRSTIAVLEDDDNL